nr:biotin/lipoyl-containing protein [uncultured Clostridium sp.]
MEVEHLLQVIKYVSNTKFTELIYEKGDEKLCLKTTESTLNVPISITAEEIEKGEGINREGGIKSPLLGTFYTNSSDSEPLTKVGDIVKKGQVLGYVEAMKLMNEITCDFEGVVKDVLVTNKQLVEYGQVLFIIQDSL